MAIHEIDSFQRTRAYAFDSVFCYDPYPPRNRQPLVQSPAKLSTVSRICPGGVP